MADTAVHSFTQKTVPISTDEMYLVQSPFGAGDDRRATLANLGTYLATSTLAAGTITTSQPLSLTQTWNAGGVTFTGLFVNVTDTASAAGSLLLDLQMSSATVFNISKSGFVNVTSGYNVSNGASTNLLQSQGTTVVGRPSDQVISVASGAYWQTLQLYTNGSVALTIDSTSLCTFANSVIRINQTPTAISQAVNMTFNSGADSASNIGHRISINMNGTTYWIPASTTAF